MEAFVAKAVASFDAAGRRICQHPFCEVPEERCEVDRIVPASKGGPTTQENKRPMAHRASCPQWLTAPTGVVGGPGHYS